MMCFSINTKKRSRANARQIHKVIYETIQPNIAHLRRTK